MTPLRRHRPEAILITNDMPQPPTKTPPEPASGGTWRRRIPKAVYDGQHRRVPTNGLLILMARAQDYGLTFHLRYLPSDPDAAAGWWWHTHRDGATSDPTHGPFDTAKDALANALEILPPRQPAFHYDNQHRP